VVGQNSGAGAGVSWRGAIIPGALSGLAITVDAVAAQLRELSEELGRPRRSSGTSDGASVALVLRPYRD